MALNIYDKAWVIAAEQTVNHPCSDAAKKGLQTQIFGLFQRWNRPNLTQEELAQFKSELESLIADFKKKHPQRIFFYDM